MWNIDLAGKQFRSSGGPESTKHESRGRLPRETVYGSELNVGVRIKRTGLSKLWNPNFRFLLWKWEWYIPLQIYLLKESIEIMCKKSSDTLIMPNKFELILLEPVSPLDGLPFGGDWD